VTTSAPAQGRRVAFAFSSLRGGGIQRVMLTLAAGFLARGFKVDLLIVDPRGELESAVPSDARIVDLRARRSLHALPALARYLRRERPAAALASQTPLNLLTLLARRLAGVPTRLVLSEHIDLDAVLQHAATWKERLFPVGARWFYPKADALVVVSRGAAARFAQATGLSPSLATVIYNPVVTPALFEQAAVPLDHPWLAGGGPPVIVSAGRLTRQKDHDTLLRAFALVRQRRRARLLLLGEGEERANLEALGDQLGIRSDVQLPGFVANPFAYMARARLFVLSSRWEGFGNVLVEAMACGVPVVSTDCPSGPAEILQDGVFGRLAAVGDSRSLADAMLQTLQEPSAPARARQRALEFSVERAVEHYLRVMLP
jgi:glycosyltransferase involved in cell wall biosynthesis